MVQEFLDILSLGIITKNCYKYEFEENIKELIRNKIYFINFMKYVAIALKI